MEIRDPIHGSIFLPEGEEALIESVEFQRLREIKQLGFSEFSFPGATHNRFLHSIGVSHIAGKIFDSIFKAYPFQKPANKARFRQMTKLASLLHDIGHGPLSHTTEVVMPSVSDLNISVYPEATANRRANHEDYTIKFVTNSNIADLIKKYYSDINPYDVACLIDCKLPCDETVFTDGKINYRTILSQIISSELDADRMDYLERDSFYCGISYGNIDRDWIIQNLTLHIENYKANLALNRRALYSFDDFLISRHHMHLMVYFHHKSVIYDEMLVRYLSSPDCQFFIPADLNEYVSYTDYKLYEHLDDVQDRWAKRIAERKPYRVATELHNQNPERVATVEQILANAGIDFIYTNSSIRLSKYHSTATESESQIYVVDQYDKWDKPAPISASTQIFQKYEGTRTIDRIYVSPENLVLAKKILTEKKY